ncbi:MAG: threonine-phosphate decarboxylase CobD [Gammaproteobacteria bacterium]|nr:threonine-phosphate decarboxylase CobD [Gammaproteobacteria bacterium]
MFKHGGNIADAMIRYGIPESNWLDLSTGINPNGYPVKNVPAHCWRDLPQDNDGLIDTAKQYYGCDSLLPVAGSQAAIQNLPRLRQPGRIAVLSPAFFEHAKAWQAAGHEVVPVRANKINEILDSIEVLVLVNPNNPTGECFTPEQCLDWYQRLAAKDGWLIVDEAFMDVTPEQSLAGFSNREGLIVLRSIGKFFGLAGIRLGFVLSNEQLLTNLQRYLGPWTVNAPARYIARQALQDQHWQQQTGQNLLNAEKELIQVLEKNGLSPGGGTVLFQWLTHPHAEDIHEALAALGILTRYFPAEHTGENSIRFGLPGNDEQWLRLSAALAMVCAE